MHWMDLIAEQRIQEAMDAGLFDNLSTKGKPLEIEDLSHVPPALRASYLVMKNSGHLPEEVGSRLEVRRIEDLLYHCYDEEEKLRLRRELAHARLRQEVLMERHRARLDARR